MQKTFYKVTDLENRIFTLIKTLREGGVKIAERNSAAGRVSFRQAESFSANDYTGKVTMIDEQEYTQALSDWGFDANCEQEIVPTTGTVASGETEGESSTSMPAAASEEAQTQSGAGSTESESGEGTPVGNESSSLTEASTSEPTPESTDGTVMDEEAATAEGMPEKAADTAA